MLGAHTMFQMSVRAVPPCQSRAAYAGEVRCREALLEAEAPQEADGPARGVRMGKHQEDPGEGDPLGSLPWSARNAAGPRLQGSSS